MYRYLSASLSISGALCASATSFANAECGSVSSASDAGDLQAFVTDTYDYVVVGGGTAGVALASRLAANEHLNIAVIEAGEFLRNTSVVNIPGLQLQASTAGNDWGFATVPQTFAGDRNISVKRGKMLGGSSGVNQMAFNRASKEEYDAWTSFASDASWSWDGLLPFFERAENYTFPPDDPFPAFTNDSFNKQRAVDVEGFGGPISASFNSIYLPTVQAYVQSLDALGFKVNSEARNGNATGVWNTPRSVDHTTGARSYSTIGYLCNQPARANLKVLVGAQATKILSTIDRGNFVATGVQLVAANETYTINSTREILLTAGTVQTPQLLELSGIGNSSILSAAGVEPLVDLPGVGENLQEHLYVGIQYQVKEGVTTFDSLRINTTFAEEQMTIYNATGGGLYAQTDNSIAFVPAPNTSALLAVFDANTHSAPEGSITSLQHPVQRAWLAEGAVAQLELILWSRGLAGLLPNASYIFILGGLSHPLSRGSVHIASEDPLAPPTIDLGFLSNAFDMQLMLEAFRLVRAAAAQSPLADLIEAQVSPNPSLTSDEDVINIIRTSSSGGSHLIGTAPLGPRANGGVVDASLKVYGTANLRVIDASVIPLHIGAHTQSTTYAIAEKAADLIQNT